MLAICKILLTKPVKAKDLVRFWRIEKGDNVQVIQGHRKGHVGKVMECNHYHNTIFIDGLQKKVRDPTTMSYYNRYEHIHLSNVMVLDPVTNECTKVKIKFIDGHDSKKYIRVSKATGNLLSVPDYIKQAEQPWYLPGKWEADGKPIVHMKDTDPATALNWSYRYEQDKIRMKLLFQNLKRFNNTYDDC